MSKCITPFAILSYPKLFDPEPVNRGGKMKDKYGCTLVFTDPSELSEMKKAAFSVAVEKFGEAKAKDMLQKGIIRLWGGSHHTFRTDAEAKNYPPGSVFINASTYDRAPGVVDGQLQPITHPDRLYPGCIVRAQVSPFWYEVDGNRGIGWGLDNVQFVRDGERIDGRVKAEDAFGALAPEDMGDLEAPDDVNEDELATPDPAADVKPSVLDELLK